MIATIYIMLRVTETFEFIMLTSSRVWHKKAPEARADFILPFNMVMQLQE
jgi:hypothetical protein